ncbi:MAG: hypothetical protein CSA68_07540 [Rhodobacterales bacterium]|nr:MAG: hypothetical protein CSA68_07540 [Rhodobacterales bacterium]
MTCTENTLSTCPEFQARIPQSTWAHLVVRLANTLLIWDMRIRTRRALKELTDEQLEDIGLSHAQAYTEAKRKFWQG